MWQQATIEITCHDHSIITCSCHIYTGVVLRAHLVRGESHIQYNANREIAATPLFFATNHTDHMFFLWRLHLVPPSHPGHSTILLRSESPSGKCTKFYTVAASINKDRLPQSLYYCLFVPLLDGCCYSCTSPSWWITHSTQCQPRGCNSVNQLAIPMACVLLFQWYTYFVLYTGAMMQFASWKIA